MFQLAPVEVVPLDHRALAFGQGQHGVPELVVTFAAGSRTQGFPERVLRVGESQRFEKRMLDPRADARREGLRRDAFVRALHERQARHLVQFLEFGPPRRPRGKLMGERPGLRQMPADERLPRLRSHLAPLAIRTKV